MNKFAEEGKCLRCGYKLKYNEDEDRWICIFKGCQLRYVRLELLDGMFAGYGWSNIFYPAAPSEPSATEKWAQRIYEHCEPFRDPETEVFDDECSLWIGELRKLLAAAPPEVKDD